MKRRNFIAGLGGAALGWPLAALAQPASMPVVGYLGTGSAGERARSVEAFRKGLKEGGFVVGKNVTIEYRWADGRYERLASLAADLVRRKVAVIATSGGPPSALAAKAATSAIPIVFVSAADPVKVGLVSSLSHPGGNVTGVANIASALDIKRLEIMRELMPGARRIAYLVNPEGEPGAKAALQEMLAAAKRMNAEIEVLSAGGSDQIDAALAGAKKSRANALLVATSGLFTTRREQLVALAARYSIPASYSRREFVAAGGLMSYGPDYDDVYRLCGVYTARILKGAKPAELPVMQETKFNLVLNLATAKKLGLPVSRGFLERVDEVIE